MEAEESVQIEHALPRLNPDTYDTVVHLAELPDLVRGYESIKLRNVTRFRERAAALEAEARGAAALPIRVNPASGA